MRPQHFGGKWRKHGVLPQIIYRNELAVCILIWEGCFNNTLMRGLLLARLIQKPMDALHLCFSRLFNTYFKNYRRDSLLLRVLPIKWEVVLTRGKAFFPPSCLPVIPYQRMVSEVLLCFNGEPWSGARRNRELLSDFQTLNLFPWQSKDSRPKSKEGTIPISLQSFTLSSMWCIYSCVLGVWRMLQGQCTSSVARQIHLCERKLLGRGRQSKKGPDLSATGSLGIHCCFC